MNVGAVLVWLTLISALILAAVAAWLAYSVSRQRARVLARIAALEAARHAPPVVAADVIGTGPAAPRSGAGRATDESFVVVMSSKLGLLAEFMKVLATVDRYAVEDRIPIVYFNKATFMYWGDDGWNGAKNGWDYYFRPLSTYQLEDLLEVAPDDLAKLTRIQIERIAGENIVFNDRLFHDQLDIFGDVLPQHRPRFEALVVERIRVREEIVAKVDAFAREHFTAPRVVGIHYRATDKLYEISTRLYHRGRDPHLLELLNVDLYLDEALAVAADDETLFFLASEDEHAVESARARLGDRLLSTRATRTRSPLPAFITDGNPAMGEEALIDCLLLARCNHLVHGVSNLTWAARLFNPAMPTTNVVGKLVGVP